MRVFRLFNHDDLEGVQMPNLLEADEAITSFARQPARTLFPLGRRVWRALVWAGMSAACLGCSPSHAGAGDDQPGVDPGADGETQCPSVKPVPNSACKKHSEECRCSFDQGDVCYCDDFDRWYCRTQSGCRPFQGTQCEALGKVCADDVGNECYCEMGEYETFQWRCCWAIEGGSCGRAGVFCADNAGGGRCRCDEDALGRLRWTCSVKPQCD